MLEFVKTNRDGILFVWGLAMLTAVVLFHIVIDPYVYFILGAALGIPVFLGIRKNGHNKA